MSRKPSKPETRIEDYLDVMTGGNAALPQPILRIEFYYAFLAGMAVELPQPILDDEKLLAKICGMEVEAPTYIPGLFPRLYAYMAKKGGQDVQVPDPILRLERYWYDYSAGEAPSVQEYTGAVPVTFTADGTPLLDYLISGNTAQSGTPTPDNPIMPQGTGERTANVMPAGELKTVESNGVTFSSDGKGKYTINGTATAYASARFNLLSAFTMPISVSNGGQGTLSFFNTSADNNVTFVFYNGTTKVDDWKQTPIRRTSAAYNAIGNKYVNSVMITVNSGATVDITITPEFTNDGVLPETFEKFGYKIPISSANTTTPVYLGEVETTRKIKKLVLDGTENFNTDTYLRFSIFISDIKTSSASRTERSYCSHYECLYHAEPYNNDWNNVYYQSGGSLYFHDRRFTTVADFKSYLAAQYAAGTPVTVWYVLANETTGIVNEPIMKIGDYADTLSMEQAGVSIPTANGSTTLDVETTVKPSEIYIKYRGEAVATLSSLPAEVSSPEANEEENPEEMEEEENER